MKWHMVGRWVGCMAMVACAAGLAVAAESSSSNTASSDVETVEMFQAMDDGTLEVKFIPMNSERGTVIITNKTKKRLRVALPGAFAGVPALAQFGGGGMGGGGMGGMGGGGMGGGGGGMQGMGGGMGGMGGGGMGGMGGGGMGGGGRFFNVMPEKTHRIKIKGVCLDHGLEDPNPKVPYDLKPIDFYTTKPGVAELVHMVGTGEVSQRAGQAAAWHMNNGMSWEELANKRIRHLVGPDTPYFSPHELKAAYKAVEVAKEREALRAKQQESSSSYSSYAAE